MRPPPRHAFSLNYLSGRTILERNCSVCPRDTPFWQRSFLVKGKQPHFPSWFVWLASAFKVTLPYVNVELRIWTDLACPISQGDFVNESVRRILVQQLFFFLWKMLHKVILHEYDNILRCLAEPENELKSIFRYLVWKIKNDFPK